MKSFDELRESFGLDKQDFYRYLQTRSYYYQEIKQKNDHYNMLLAAGKKGHYKKMDDSNSSDNQGMGTLL